MGKYWKLMAFYDAETKTYSEAEGSYATSPFSPETDGTLVGIRVVVGAASAAALTELVQFRLTCTLWTPNAIEVGGVGCGLHTAPAFPAPIADFPVNQPVKTTQKITVEGRNTTAETPVTVEIQVWGCFES
jgi:hypothetical protein